jgi:hypothetical protein
MRAQKNRRIPRSPGIQDPRPKSQEDTRDRMTHDVHNAQSTKHNAHCIELLGSGSLSLRIKRTSTRNSQRLRILLRKLHLRLATAPAACRVLCSVGLPPAARDCFQCWTATNATKCGTWSRCVFESSLRWPSNASCFLLQKEFLYFH